MHLKIFEFEIGLTNVSRITLSINCAFHTASSTSDIRTIPHDQVLPLFFFHRIILPYYFLTISIEIYSQPVPSKFGRLVTAANRVTTHPVRPLLFFLKSSRRLFFPLPTVLSFYVTSLNFRGRAVELSFGTCSLRLNLNTDRSHRAYAFCTCDKIIYRQNLVPSALIFSYAIEISFQLVTEARFRIYKRSALARIKYGL